MPPKRSTRSSRSSRRKAKEESPEPTDEAMDVSSEGLDVSGEAAEEETAAATSEENVEEAVEAAPAAVVEEAPAQEEAQPMEAAVAEEEEAAVVEEDVEEKSPKKRASVDEGAEEAEAESEPPAKKSKPDEKSDSVAEEEEAEEEEVKKRAEEEKKKLEDEKKKEEAKKKEEEKPVETEEQKKERREREKKEREEKAKARELEKFWKAVKDDPSDFTGWTYLLQFADNLADVNSGRDAYNAFLVRYPYCYGYWKKFADFEKKKGFAEKCMLVFERGVQAIPLSTDLWIHYLNHVKAAAEYKDNKEFIRTQYERAVEACGREWRSDKLWDHYVKFETEAKNNENVFKLYQRILKNPTQGLSHQFEMFRDFIKDNNPKDVMEVNEFLALRKEILANMKGEEDGGDKDKKEGEKKEDAEKVNGEKEKEGEAGGDEPAPGEDVDGTKSDEETLAIREKIIFTQRKIYKETEEKVNARWKYEEGIKRPYFHVKPLERGQLKNWHDYIDFTKKSSGKEGGDLTEVEILYERCLIACALYEEFWMKYVSWVEKREDGDFTDKIRDILARACTHHLPTKVDIHERWAAFEESKGEWDKASEVLENLEKKHPEMIRLMMNRINFERRRGNFDKVVELYQASIKAAKSQSTASELSIKLSRFTRLQRGDADKATEIINTALELDHTNSKLYLQLLDILLHASPIDTKAVVELFDKAINNDKMSSKNKFFFSQRKVEFLEDFGPDIKAVQAAQTAHNILVKETKTGKEADSAVGGGGGGSSAPPTGTGISTIEGRTGKKNTSNGSYPPVSNSASYQASQNSAYNNYGSRYSQYPSNYNYNQYYQGGGGQGGYGGGYGGSGGGY